MLSNIQKNIIIKAARIRMERGEELEEILSSYPRLTAAEKAEILDRLRYYRKEHGLGCLAAVAQRAGEGITDDTLRGLLSGDLALGIKDWRRIGRALDKLGTDQGEKKEA